MFASFVSIEAILFLCLSFVSPNLHRSIIPNCRSSPFSVFIFASPVLVPLLSLYPLQSLLSLHTAALSLSRQRFLMLSVWGGQETSESRPEGRRKEKNSLIPPLHSQRDAVIRKFHSDLSNTLANCDNRHFFQNFFINYWITCHIKKINLYQCVPALPLSNCTNVMLYNNINS